MYNDLFTYLNVHIFLIIQNFSQMIFKRKQTIDLDES